MAQIRLIGTDPSQVSTNGMLGNLAFQNAESVSLEKLVVTSTVGINGNVTTSSGSAISYGGGETYQIWNDDPESSAVDTNGQPPAFRTLKTFVASKSGSLKFKFSAYIQSGTYYWAWRIINQASTVLSSGNYNSGLDAGQVGYVHEYRRFVASVSNVTPGDILTLQMVSANSSGTPPLTGNATGQILYAKEFRAYSTTPSIDHGGSSNVWGKNVGIGVHIPGSYNLPLPPITRLDVRGPNVANNVASLGSVPPATMYVGSSSGWGQNDGGSIALGGAADNSQFTATYAGIAGRRESVHGWEYGGYLTLSTVTIGTDQLSERVRINSIGHVGIGNNLPSTLLNVGSSTTANTTVRLNNSLTAGSDTGMYSLGLDLAGDLAGMKLNYGDRIAKGLQIFTSSGYGYPISFSTNGSQNMIIGSTGKILAGALTSINGASFQISIDSGASTSPYFAVFNTASSPTSAASTRLDLGFLSGTANYNATNTVLGAINWMGQGNDAGYGGAFIQGIVTSGGDIARASGHGVNLIFGTKPTNTAGAEERARIRSDGTFEIKGAGTAGSSPGFSVNPSTPANSFVIDSSGRLGIGINTPEATLDISDSIKIRGQRKSYYYGGLPPNYPSNPQDRIVELTSKFAPSAGTDVLINNTGGVQGDWQVDVVISGDLNGPGVGVSRLTCRFQSRYNHGAGAIDLLNIQVIDKTIVPGTYYSTIPVNIAVTMSGNNIMLTIGGSTNYTTGIVNVKWMGSGTSSGSPTSLTLPGTTTSSSWVTETAWSTDKVTGNNILIAKTGDTERLRITSTGTLNLVGAGTAGSTQAVSLSGTAPVNSLVLDSSGRVGLGTSATAAYGGQLAIAINGAGDFIVLADNTTSSGAAAPRLGCLGNDLVFKTNSGSAAATGRLTINSTGLTTCLKGVQAPMGWYYQNTYTCDSTWGTAWQTVIPNGTISFGTYVVTLFWDYAGAPGSGQPYYLTAATLFTGAHSTNGSGVENEVALLSSTHTGATGAYIRVRTANSPAGTTSLQVNLVNFSVVSGTQFTVYVQRIGY